MTVFHHLNNRTLQIVNIWKLEWRIRVEAAPVLSNVTDVLLQNGLFIGLSAMHVCLESAIYWHANSFIVIGKSGKGSVSE